MYDIDIKPYKQRIQSGWVGIAFGAIVTIIILIIFFINFDKLSFAGYYVLGAFFVCFVGTSVCVGIREIYKGSKMIKRVEYLNNHGKLLKNIPCHIEYREDPQTHVPDPIIVVECVLSDGSEIALKSDPDFIPIVKDQRRKIDLVIDVNNPSYYFLGFNINRIGGNREYDFYTPRGFNFSKDNTKKS